MWRRPLRYFCIGVGAFLLASAGLAIRLYYAFQPYRSPAIISPNERWSAWLQRPDGSQEPQYYSIMAAKRRLLMDEAPCQLGGITNWYAERYTKLTWLTNTTVLLRYGMAARDTARTGKPFVSSPNLVDCAHLRLVTQHNRDLDAAAIKANAYNANYAVPIPEDPAIAAMEAEYNAAQSATNRTD